MLTPLYFFSTLAMTAPVLAAHGSADLKDATLGQRPIVLYTTSYSGNISTLSLTQDHDGNLALAKVASQQACGGSPSWLTFDERARILYCSDEDEPGSLSSFQAGEDGTLNLQSQGSTIGGDVFSSLYGRHDGSGFIAIAQYSGHISTFALPLTSNSTALQTITYNQTAPGPVPDRQDGSHVHQVILDPTNRFMLAPDLGEDVVHVFSIDNISGILTALSDLTTPPGSGPRHLAFKESANQTMMYLACEISNEIISYELQYSTTGLSFNQIDSKTPFPGGVTDVEMAISEIRIANDSLYVANRNMSSPLTNDTITRFLIDDNSGIPSYVEQTSTHGSYPRTFAFNRDATLVAIGNQKSGTVVVLKRDPSSGKLFDEFVSVLVDDNLAAGGLSSVIFAE